MLPSKGLEHPLQQVPRHVPAIYINWGRVRDIQAIVNFIHRGFCLGPREALTWIPLMLRWKSTTQRVSRGA